MRWALAAGHPSALSLASYLAIGVEQYGSDVDSVRTLAQAARDERVLAEASAQQLLDLGVALAFLDLDVVDDLAIRAITIADDRPSQLAAHHLAGLAGAYHDRLSDALVHLGLAERLAMDLDDRWQLAAVRQMRGVAFRHASPPDSRRALADFERAMRGYLRAGDAMHANNARFMMAYAAADDGLERKRATVWADECADYARSTDNVHELAHARLVQGMLRSDDHGRADDVDELDDLVATFRGLGDLRCVTRSLVLRSRREPASARVPLLEQALAVADAAGDRTNQVTVLTGWSTRTGRAATAWRRSARSSGSPTSRAPTRHPRPARPSWPTTSRPRGRADPGERRGG